MLSLCTTERDGETRHRAWVRTAKETNGLNVAASPARASRTDALKLNTSTRKVPEAMLTRIALLGLLIPGLGLVGPVGIAADPWTARLEQGGEVRVDPSTNRPTVVIGGEEVQLWDGIHRLQDGRELTVESGRVVPNREILRARKPWPEPAVPEEGTGRPIVGESPCGRLVARVCGADGSCSDATACGPARQLLAMEREEQQEAGTPDRTTFTSGKCVDALGDAFFKPCTPAD